MTRIFFRTGSFLALCFLGGCTDGDRIEAATSDAGSDAASEAGMEAGPQLTCPDPNEAIDPTAVIDDLEDQNASILPVSGRSGGWWTAGDETPGATIVPALGDPALPELIPGERCGSRFAMRVTGQGFNDWGAMLGLSLVYESAGMAPYDASSREGVTFWARIGDTSTNQVRFAVTDVNSEPAGGLCDPEGGTNGCFDTFGVVMSSLDTSWKLYKIPFSGLTQRDFGRPAEAVEKTAIYFFSFNFEPNAIFDLWVDDISFY